MPNGYLEKIQISKRVFDVFVKMKTQDYTGEPISVFIIDEINEDPI